MSTKSMQWRLSKKATYMSNVVSLLIGCAVLVQSHYMIDKTKVLENKGLHGHAFRNLTMKTVVNCFLNCFEDCFCMAFQMCNYGNTECQLLSSNRFQTPSAFYAMQGCSYYDMIPDLEQAMAVNDSKCSSPLVCQFHEYFCENGGNYVALSPTNLTTPRYKCNCPAGYTGQFCQDMIKSCRGYNSGNRLSGIYKVIRSDNRNPIKVFCDFDSNSSIAWTLIQSYKLGRKSEFDKPYFVNSIASHDFPRHWDAYRLSKYRTNSIQNDSSKFRITCNYNTEGVVYRDYLQATKKQVDIMTFEYDNRTSPNVCFRVEYINVRGYDCANCTIPLFQLQDNYPFHSDSGPNITSSYGCEFQALGGTSCNARGEDNFGYYNCINPAHRCSSSEAATTQTWLGGD